MVINTDQLLNRPSELHRRYSGRLAMQKAQQEKMVGGASVNIVLTKKSIKNVDTIKTNIVKIESILKGTLALDKKQLDDKKRDVSKKRKEKIETKLETKPNAETGKISMPAAPRMGILDFVKNFIGNVLLGYFAIRLVKHLPKIMPIVKFLGNAADFIIDVGGKLLNGLVSFIDAGYKAYDATRGFIKNLGGENFAKGFDKFLGAIDTALFLTTALATSLAIDAVSGDDGPGIMDLFGKKGAAKTAAKGAAKAAGSAAKGAGLGAGAVAGVVAGAGLLASALGEGAFQLRKIATKPIQDAQKAFDNERNPLMKIGRGALLGGMYTLLGPLSAVGVLLDIVGAPFRYAIELLRFPFLSEEDKVKQANNLAKFDARIREDFRKALNMVTLGFAFKEKGSFGNIYGNKGSQKEMMSKMQGGGITRGGKSQRGARRTISKGKYKRVLAPQKPSKIEIKGEKNDPNKQTGEQLDKTKYFGPILAITSKISAKQEPTQRDYQNVGLGINMLISQGVQQQQLKGGLVAAFAGGGLVDPDVLSAAETGGDISNWVAKTFQGEVESNAQKTLRMIREMKEDKKTADPVLKEAGSDPGVGGGMTKGTWGPLLDLIAGKESGGNYEAMYPSTTLPGATKLTIAEVARRATGAVGKYQQLPRYLVGRAKAAGLDVNKDLYSAENQEKIIINVNIKGRGGERWLRGEMSDEDFMQGLSQEFASLPNAQGKFYYAGQRSSMTPDRIKSALSKVKKGGYSQQELAMSPSGGALGAGYGSGGSKIAGDLGDYMKQTRIPTGSIHQHPRHPKWKRRGYNSYHNEGRAIDLGGYGPAHPSSGGRDEQAPILRALIEWNKQRGVTPVEVIHGSPAFRGFGKYESAPNALHSHHVHVAYAKGGETLDGPHLAMVGEKGREIVIDNDSVESHPEVRQMLLAINQASNYQGVLNAIRQYAPYDAMSPQTIIVPTQGGDEDEYDSGMSGGVAFMPIGGGDADPFATLYKGDC
jgi:hypothetical protein